MGCVILTSVVLLEQLKAFTEKIMSDMILPVAMQQGDTEQAYRAPEVYLMRLPDSRAAKKKGSLHHPPGHSAGNGAAAWQRGAHGRVCAIYFLLLQPGRTGG